MLQPDYHLKRPRLADYNHIVAAGGFPAPKFSAGVLSFVVFAAFWLLSSLRRADYRFLLAANKLTFMAFVAGGLFDIEFGAAGEY